MEMNPHSKRGFWARPKFIIWAIVTLLLVIIILQNSEPTSIDILFWSLPSLPKLALILISMIIGAIITLAIFYQTKRSRTTYTPE